MCEKVTFHMTKKRSDFNSWFWSLIILIAFLLKELNWIHAIACQKKSKYIGIFVITTSKLQCFVKTTTVDWITVNRYYQTRLLKTKLKCIGAYRFKIDRSMSYMCVLLSKSNRVYVPTIMGLGPCYDSVYLTILVLSSFSTWKSW